MLFDAREFLIQPDCCGNVLSRLILNTILFASHRGTRSNALDEITRAFDARSGIFPFVHQVFCRIRRAVILAVPLKRYA